MARITVEDCIDKFSSRFELVLIASQRARKLHSGENPTVDKDNDKNTVIALREIATSSLSKEEMRENLIQEYQTVTINDEENENLELYSQNESKDEEEKLLENDKEEQLSSSSQQIEDEMKNLVNSEDKELEENFEISEDLQSPDLSSNNEDEADEADGSV